MLDHVKLARFRLTLEAKESLHLPAYKGSTFRGGFGHAFKRVACPLRCREACQMPKVCVYAYVFETPPPEGAEMLRKYPHAPHPFVIEPPLEERRDYEAGEVLQVGLVLIGRALDYLPYFIYAFDELGRIGVGKGRGRYQLKEVRVKNEELSGEKGKGDVIYSGETKTLQSHYPILSGRDLIGEVSSSFHPKLSTRTPQLSLHFVTPTRLKYGESLTSDLEFHILIRSLLRRISSLSYFHCGKRLTLDFKGLIEQAMAVNIVERHLRWLDWERYSHRQETKMKLGGFVGQITFQGDLEEFWPILRLGELVHVGKGTAFGLGQYRIKREGQRGQRSPGKGAGEP